MTVLVVLTLIAAGLIVVTLALVLIMILLRLRSTLSKLETVNVGLRDIAGSVEPLERVLTEVNSDLAGVSRGVHDALRTSQ